MPTIINTQEETNKTVPIDTSGDSIDIEIENKKDMAENTEQEENSVEEISIEENNKEIQSEEGEEYSQSVKKRIDKLTFKLRESERQKEEALKYANSVKSERDNLKTKINKVDEGYVTEYSARVKSQLDKAQDILARLAVEENNVKQNQQYLSQSQIAQPSQPITQPQAQEPSDKAKAWAEEREWFGNDTIMTAATFAIHQDLANEGFDLESDEYYTEVDARLKKSFPQKFNETQTEVENKKPQQKVASAARNTESTTGKRKVKLSPSEVQMAKKLNVPLNEYAKFVKR